MNFISQIINKSEFNKNVITLFTGQLTVQVISFLVGFVVTRLYLPEQIGVYSMFIATTTILSMFSTGRYDTAIVVEKEEGKIKSLWLLSLTISFTFNFLLFLGFYFFSHTIIIFFKVDKLDKWILLIPLAVFINAIYSATQYYFNRYMQYGKINTSDILKSVLNSIFSVGFGLSKILNGGLIFSSIISNFFATSLLLIRLPKKFWSHYRPINSSLIEVAKIYKNYLTLYSLSGVLNALVVNGTPLFIVYFFTQKLAGYYFMAEKVVSIPLGLLVTSISKVFFQKASELYKTDKKEFLALIYTIQKKMIMFLLPFLLLVSIISPYFFKLFGEGWYQSGELVKYFVILVFFSNMVSPVGSISNVINRLDILLYFNISIALLRGITFYIGSLYLSFEYSLLISSIVISLCYLTLDVVLKKIIKKEVLNEKRN